MEAVVGANMAGTIQSSELLIFKQRLNSMQISDYEKVEIVMNDASICACLKRRTDKLNLRQRIAEIIGTTETCVQRSQFIIAYGTEDDKERARKGGRENSLWNISQEIKARREGKTNMETGFKENIKIQKIVHSNHFEETERVCKTCGRTLPITKFALNKGNYRNRECNNCRGKKYKHRDIKGKNLLDTDIAMTEEQLNDYLYNENNEVEYTLEDMLEEIRINGENGIGSIETTIKIHDNVIKSQQDVLKVIALINTLSHKLYQLNQLIKE